MADRLPLNRSVSSSIFWPGRAASYFSYRFQGSRPSPSPFLSACASGRGLLLGRTAGKELRIHVVRGRGRNLRHPAYGCTVVVLFIFLLLAYAGDGERQVRATGGAESGRERADSGACGAKSSIAKGASLWTTTPSFSALLLRDSSRDLPADADAIAKGLHLQC